MLKEHNKESEYCEKLKNFLKNFSSSDKFDSSLKQLAFRYSLVDRRVKRSFIDLNIWDNIVERMKLKFSKSKKFVLTFDSYSGIL